MSIAKVGFLWNTGPSIFLTTYMYVGLQSGQDSDVSVRQSFSALVAILMGAIEQITACLIVRDSVFRRLLLKKQGYSDSINIMNH